jgi:hypothetical protein
MVIEVYSWEDGFRYINHKEYKSYTDWEKDYMIMKFRDTWVGHKIYNISMQEFEKLTEIQRNNLDCKAVFDKEAFFRKH